MDEGVLVVGLSGQTGRLIQVLGYCFWSPSTLREELTMVLDFAELFTFAQSEALNERENLIIELRYGFMGGEPHTLEDIGNSIGVSRERIRQILRKCYRKIAARGRRDINGGQADKPCGALLSYINQTVRPQDDDAVERLVDLIENELSYLPLRTHSLPLLAYLAFPNKKVFKQRITEAGQVLKRRKQERWKEYKQQTLWEKFQNLLSFVIWAGQTKPLSAEDIVSFRRQRNVSLDNNHSAGSFYSSKLGRVVQYESELEYDFLQRLEIFDQVIFYQEQPFRIPYEFNNEKRLYYPDILFVLEDGQGIVVEIKPVFKMALQMNLKKWTALRSFCAGNGLGLLITDGRLAIQQIQRFEINPRFAEDILSALERGALSWGEYKCIRDKYGVTRGDFLALVLRHKLVWQLSPFRLSISA